MVDTSKYKIAERLISVWVHEKEQTGETYEEIRESSFHRFNRAASSEANLQEARPHDVHIWLWSYLQEIFQLFR